MNYARMVIEKEAPGEYGYDRIRYNLSESSIADQKLSDIGPSLPDLTLFYGEHRGDRELRALIAAQDEGISADDVAGHRGCCRRAVHHLDLASVGTRPPRRHQAQLRHQHRNAEGDRLRHQLCRSGFR